MINEETANQMSARGVLSDVDDLDAWLAESYPTAYRTACLVLRSPVDAEDAVQDAFLRVWRFRDAIPGAQLTVIPHAGHISNMEQPETFNAHVRRFCTSEHAM